MNRNNFFTSKCTICRKNSEEIFKHALLKVIVCKPCYSEVYSKLIGIENRCFWCTKEGELLQCVQCHYKCCYECINNNLGADYMNCLNEKNWICFVCDSNPIEQLQEEFIEARKTSKSGMETLSPEGAGSSIDISSPFVTVDDCDESSKRFHLHNSYTQDLDSILSMYEKQIQASLELEDANVPAIINEINSIKTEQLLLAIHSYKKCLSAFASDLQNLESRVSHAKSTNSQSTLTKLTSLLQILVQHHIFNRLSHPKARIRDDHPLESSNMKLTTGTNNKVIIVPSSNTNQKMLLIMDPKILKDSKKSKLNVDKTVIDYNQSPNSGDSLIRNRSKATESFDKIGLKLSTSADGNSSDSSWKKQSQVYDAESNESTETNINRKRRSLNTPSWMSDFKIEKESSGHAVQRNQDKDEDWTDYRIKNGPDFPRKRGRPPKFLNNQSANLPDVEFDLTSIPKRGRGRPRKVLTLNDKQPRYYIPKLNGDALCPIENSI